MTVIDRKKELADLLKGYLVTSQVCYHNKLKVYTNVPIACITAENLEETRLYQNSQNQIDVLVCKVDEVLLAIEFVDELEQMKRTHIPTMQFYAEGISPKMVDTIEGWLEERLKSDTKCRQSFERVDRIKGERVPLRQRLMLLSVG